MNHDSALVILLLVPAWARWCELYAIAVFPYARQEGKGKVWHDTTVIPGDLILGAITPILLTLALCLTLGSTVPLVVTTFTCISGVLFSHWFQSHLGGQTGDTYGAVVELSETSALLMTALVAAFIGT